MQVASRIYGTSVRIARTANEVLSAVATASSSHPVRIATLNPEFLLEAQHNTKFRQALEQMTQCTCDGTGLFLWLRALHRVNPHIPLPERLAGAGLTQQLLERYQDGSKRFLLVGDASALIAQANLRTRYPQLALTAVEEGILDPAHPRLSTETLAVINSQEPDIVLLGFGAPKQERSMMESTYHFVPPVMIGVGGTFKFYGDKPRAPKLLRSLGLEWLWRLFVEPKHAKRVWRAVVVFSLLSCRELLTQASGRRQSSSEQ